MLQIRNRIYAAQLGRRCSFSDIHGKAITLPDGLSDCIDHACCRRESLFNFIIGRLVEMQTAMNVKDIATRADFERSAEAVVFRAQSEPIGELLPT
jgi:hypothetical protein